MSRPRIVGPERVAEFTADWASDQPSEALAVKYGCSKRSISVIAKRLGLPARPTGRRPAPVEDPALTGGTWLRNERGVMVWHPAATAQAG